MALAMAAVSCGEEFSACTNCTTGGSAGSGGSGGTGATGGSASTGGMAGSGGQGGSVPCPDPQTKLCGTICASIHDPAYGCGNPSSCDPCLIANGTSKCDVQDKCAVKTCDGSFRDCDDAPGNGCETNTDTSMDHCGGCGQPCPYSDGVCNAGSCETPCGPPPQDGKWYVCVVYPHPAMPTAHVGIAGGASPPGQSIQDVWADPYNLGCVAPAPNQDWVLCPLAAGNAQTGTDIQFRHGLHLDAQSGTIAGTWGCGNLDCSIGSAYVYDPQKVEAGKLVNGTLSGILTTVPHYAPPNLLNLQVLVP